MTIIIKRPYTPAFSRAVGHPVSVAQLRKIVGSPAHVRYGPYGVAVVYNPKSRRVYPGQRRVCRVRRAAVDRAGPKTGSMHLAGAIKGVKKCIISRRMVTTKWHDMWKVSTATKRKLES